MFVCLLAFFPEDPPYPALVHPGVRNDSEVV